MTNYFFKSYVYVVRFCMEKQHGLPSQHKMVLSLQTFPQVLNVRSM